MEEISRVIDRYFEIWNERDTERRRALIGRTWTDGASLVGPLIRADGVEGIERLADGLREHFAAHHFRLAGPPDAHNGAVRVAWEIAPEDGGQPVAAGVDFAMLAADGRIRSVFTFVDRFPEGSDRQDAAP